VLPGVELLSVVWLVDIYAIVFGVALIALGSRCGAIVERAAGLGKGEPFGP
jgi:hypothetical protein